MARTHRGVQSAVTHGTVIHFSALHVCCWGTTAGYSPEHVTRPKRQFAAAAITRVEVSAVVLAVHDCMHAREPDLHHTRTRSKAF